MSDETPVPGEFAIGVHLAGCRLDEIIARGGVAVVCRALDGRLVVDTRSGQVPADTITRLP